MKNLQTILKLTTAILWLGMSSQSAAIELAGVNIDGSGFLTFAVGKTLNAGAAQPGSSFRCPCFVSDFAQTSVYQQGGVQWRPDTKLGLQGSAVFNPRFSVTGQVVARGAAGGQLDFEWLYADWKLNDELTLQVGRKRLPLLYYSESQDLGMSYPWVHLAPQMYGWEIVNYNGVNMLYRDDWGDWSSSMNFFAGDETVKDSGYWKLYNGGNTRTDSRWSNILGADLVLSRDWFTSRLVYLQSNIQNTNPFSTTPFVYNNKTPQNLYGISLNADADHWVARAEFLYINRKASYGEDFSEVYGLGYRVGKWLPMVTYNNYHMVQRLDVAAGLDPAQAEAHSTTSLLLRYELNKSSALKLQYDRWKNNAQTPFFTATPNTSVPMGHLDLLTASYDLVF
ncbi:MAG: hypothetical protein PHI11_08460 [Gallionella sp.]|nr:hypothetical protein [Gallionella sp.]